MFIDITESTEQPTLIALVSGSQALALEEADDADIVAGALKVLRLIVGEELVEVPEGYTITRWGRDPFSRGSYSYVSVGCTPLDMDALARPLEGGRVFFAGEHTNSEYPASVHGAFISGRREARHMLRTWHDLTLPDMISYSSQMAPEQQVCSLCGGPDDDGPEGHLVGPFKLPGKGNTLVKVHEQCALYCPEVSKEGPHWYNISKAVRRGRRSKCTSCQQMGATIGCYVETCKVNNHWHCAVESGWQFDTEHDGRNFFCARHRKNAAWQAMQTGSTANQWPDVARPVGGRDSDHVDMRDGKRQRLLPPLQGSGGVPIWLNCRPLSLVGLPISALRSIASDPIASALVPDNVLRALSTEAHTPFESGGSAEGAGVANTKNEGMQMDMQLPPPASTATAAAAASAVDVAAGGGRVAVASAQGDSAEGGGSGALTNGCAVEGGGLSELTVPMPVD